MSSQVPITYHFPERRRVRPRRSHHSLQSLVLESCRNQSVLDVGCAGAHAALHQQIRRMASRVLGVDLSEKGVTAMNALGYEAIRGDATTIDVGDMFDVIVAGEIIEHVDNPGALIRNLRRHLKPGGRILLTTPHVFFAMHVLEFLFCSPYNRWHSDHVAWYCYYTLQALLERNGMEMEACHYVTRSRKIRRVLSPLRLPCPGWLASTLVVVARPAAV